MIHTRPAAADLIHTVAKTGGHLGSSLGVVELTVALHHVFNTPEDKIIWDVGHQAYIHKMLTGRRNRMHTIRQQGGLSGVCAGRCRAGKEGLDAGCSARWYTHLGMRSSAPADWVANEAGRGAAGARMPVPLGADKRNRCTNVPQACGAACLAL